MDMSKRIITTTGRGHSAPCLPANRNELRLALKGLVEE